MQSRLSRYVSAFGKQFVGISVGQGAPWRQATDEGGSVWDAVEYLGDEIRLGDICDDAKLLTAQMAQYDVDFKGTL